VKGEEVSDRVEASRIGSGHRTVVGVVGVAGEAGVAGSPPNMPK
jgi:hypothetical protein